jgi:hypothetical protein
MKIDGACHCGYIRVEGEADPEKTTVCHCTDCQVGTGSAFRVNVPVPGATFRITGQPNPQRPASRRTRFRNTLCATHARVESISEALGTGERTGETFPFSAFQFLSVPN